MFRRFNNNISARGMLLCKAKIDFKAMTDKEVIDSISAGKLSFYGIENALSPDYSRAVHIRREYVKQYISPRPDADEKKHGLDLVPYHHCDWNQVVGQSCENIIGYIRVPVGLAGPVRINGQEFPIPMATTEGALVASTHRGARAISRSGGCTVVLTNEGMTRAPVVEVPTLEIAAELKKFCEEKFPEIKAAFESTTRFGKLLQLKVALSGRKVFLRFRAFTGDAMGMNMVTKGVDKALAYITASFPDMKVLALSGNYCTDKKPSAINWIEGRGKSVCAEAVIDKKIVEETLKTTVDALVSLNIDKNLIGSAMAGSLGGFNAQAANVVAAVFLATGQDPAQVVESSTCLTTMSKLESGDLLIGVVMPSIEVGTVGGGTGLDPQHGCLRLIGCDGSNKTTPGANSSTLAKVVAAGVLSAELSLMSGLAAGHLLRAHMDLNRNHNASSPKK
jgi:hydroxymethylglutaryl-CoA reductase (NADPH)